MTRFASLLLMLLILACACSTPDPGPASVRGVLLDVRASSISQVDSLRLRSDDGREWDFVGGPQLAADPEGSPGHLRQHMARVDEVMIFYEETSDGLVAQKVQDALQ